MRPIPEAGLPHGPGFGAVAEDADADAGAQGESADSIFFEIIAYLQKVGGRVLEVVDRTSA